MFLQVRNDVLDATLVHVGQGMGLMANDQRVLFLVKKLPTRTTSPDLGISESDEKRAQFRPFEVRRLAAQFLNRFFVLSHAEKPGFIGTL